MTEIEIRGERIFINGTTITSENEAVQKLVASLPIPKDIPIFAPEYVIAMSAVERFNAKIISGDALTTLAPKKGDLY